MKKFSFSFLVVALIAVITYSCIDDTFDTPPQNELPVGTVVTLARLREICPPGNTLKILGDSSVYAVVTMDEKSGNIYKNAFVQDRTGAVNLRFQSSSALYEGDSIRIYLKNAKLSWYNNLFQIDSLHADSSIVKQATRKFIEPQKVKITDINLDKSFFQSRLVKIKGVQVVESDLNKTWADAAGQQYGEVYIQDTLGNRMMIRTSGFAKFASQKVPQGFGTITAIVGIYNQTVQLYIRRTSEVQFDSARWTPTIPPTNGTGTYEDPFDVATGIIKQNETPYVVGWVKGYIVGAVKAEVTTITSSNDVLFTAPFNSATNVLIANSASETDYNKCIIVNLPSGKPLRTNVNLLDHPENLGKWLNVKGTFRTYFGVAGLRDGTGEKTDYDLEGEIDDPDPGIVTEITIANLRALYLGSTVTIPSGKKIIGTVISDKDALNIHGNNIQIVDAAGSGIMVRFTAAHPYVLNDRIEVIVSNNTLESFNGVLQVNNASLANAQKIGTGTVTPVDATITQIRANFEQYESKLVRIVNSTITNSGGTYGGNSGNSTINDGTGSLVLYTRSQATFAGTAVPTGAKTVIGIVSEYSTTSNPNNFQLLLRNLSDVQNP